MRLLTRNWAFRLIEAKRSVSSTMRFVRLTSLRDDIEALSDSVLRAGYKIHNDVVVWAKRLNTEVSIYKED